MQWQPVAEGPDERTEVSEVAGRGCLVRIVVKGADGRWTPTAMCFCPGVRAAELGSQAAAPAPAPAPAPAAAPPTEQSVQVPTEQSVQVDAPAPDAGAPAEEPAAAAPAPAPTPAPAPAAAPAEDVMVVLRELATMRAAVIGAFRGKVGVASGPLGFLDNATKVGSMHVQGFGDWVWRIDPNEATLRSKNKIIALRLPDHARDDAFDGAILAAHMGLTNRTAVGHNGSTYPADAAQLDQLIRGLEQEKVIRVFSKNPTLLFILPQK
ncbi:MAG TPA: hypothetical protein VG755_35845 [Nannocystaceae bacterium]|nr:hypothetical protein [Nannocystaceae bacterium]